MNGTNGANGTNWSGATRLSAVELHACWTALELGDTPTTLALRHPPGHTPAERGQIYTAAFTGLRARGLAGQARDEPVPELAAALRLVAGATAEWDLWRSDGVVALGAVRGTDGVVARQDTHGYALLRTPGVRVPAILVGLLTPLSPGWARPVNIPADALDTACREAVDGSLWTLADRLAGRGVAAADARSLARMCSGIEASAQLGGLTRRAGVEHRTPWVVGVHRAGHGDYLQIRRPRGASATVTVAPVTAEQLLDHVRQLVPT